MHSLRAAAKLYDGMGSIAESRLDPSSHQSVVRGIRESISAFREGRASLDRALDQIPRIIEYLRANWDEDYERLLRETGFKGSLFILREYKIHLEGVRRALDAQVDEYEASLARIEAGPQPASPFAPLLEASARAMCRALIRFLDFEDNMAQTQIVNITRVATAGA